MFKPPVGRREFQGPHISSRRRLGLPVELGGMDERSRADGRTDQDRAATFLSLLESRRSSADQGMWQAPTLTIAAQAFLLAVLTDKTVSDTARLTILVAGIAACVAAILSLVRLRAREILFSEAIADACDKAGLPDPRPFALSRRPAEHTAGPVDRAVRAVGASQRLPTVYLFWIFALLLFVVADMVAFRSTG